MIVRVIVVNFCQTCIVFIFFAKTFGENKVLLYIIKRCQILLLIIMWYGKGHKLIFFKPLVNRLVHAISKWFYTS